MLHTDLDVETLGTVRRDLFRLHEDPEVPEHVRQGAAALINYYGAILDERAQRLAALTCKQ